MEVIENAKKRLAETEAIAERLRQFIALYDELSLKNNVALGDSTAAEVIQPAVPVEKSVSAKHSQIVELAKTIIRENRRPMTRSELVDSIESRGISVGGVDKNKNMGTIVWRSKQFENVEGVGYWPLEDKEWIDI